MNYLIVEDSIISNIIVCGNDKDANKFGAVQYYEGANIGDVYNPPSEPEPTPSNLREDAYNNLKVIEWDGAMLTVTQAAQQWAYYAAEGNTTKTTELTALIAEAKNAIRETYPDKEV